MKKYIVSVVRVSYGCRNIEITANSEAEARATVLDWCGDYEFSEKDAEYSIEQVSDQGETA